MYIPGLLGIFRGKHGNTKTFITNGHVSTAVAMGYLRCLVFGAVINNTLFHVLWYYKYLGIIPEHLTPNHDNMFVSLLR